MLVQGGAHVAMETWRQSAWTNDIIAKSRKTNTPKLLASFSICWHGPGTEYNKMLIPSLATEGWGHPTPTPPMGKTPTADSRLAQHERYLGCLQKVGHVTQLQRAEGNTECERVRTNKKCHSTNARSQFTSPPHGKKKWLTWPQDGPSASTPQCRVNTLPVTVVTWGPSPPFLRVTQASIVERQTSPLVNAYLSRRWVLGLKAKSQCVPQTHYFIRRPHPQKPITLTTSFPHPLHFCQNDPMWPCLIILI